jgi:Protein of unknown function (DUF429)
VVEPVCVAVDWSGDATDRGQRTRIVAATVRDGRVTAVVDGRTRSEAAHAIVELVGADAPVFVGLDFSFSVPAGFAATHGCASIDDVWALIERDGEEWLRACTPPFWGRAGTRCTADVVDRFRVCETRLREQGRQPKSIFQIAGAGAVGTGSLRGMPWLAWMRARGVAIWPFDAPGSCTALEVYPSLYAKVATNDAVGRVAHLAHFPDSVLGTSVREAAVATDDAFDAVVSALAMWHRRAELLTLRATTDPITLIEGAVWT